jgi:hypothetical protein
MHKLILALPLVMGVTLADHDYDPDADTDSGYDRPYTYTTIPYGDPGRPSGYTTYDRTYTHLCQTMRLGLGWTTTCR